MPLPELTDEITSVHTRCPFCGGEYTISGALVRHSVPACDEFVFRASGDFITNAREEELKRLARRTMNGAPKP